MRLDAAAWDRQIEQDIAAGRLERLTDEALDDLRKAPSTDRWRSTWTATTRRAMNRFLEDRSMSGQVPVIHCSPDIVSGTPVFYGTRVPARNLFDYLEGGETIEQFLDDFPSVSREQAIAALELASEALAASARSTR